MEQKRKLSSSFKAKVVLEALSERLTLAELAKMFEIHPNQIATWKKHFLDQAHSVFDKKNVNGEGQQSKEVQQLFEKIGKLQVENDFLKKVSSALNR